MLPREIEIPAADPERFRQVLPRARYREFEDSVRQARRLLEGRVVWNVNSTARGGGVVELLRPHVAYARGAGIDVRWAVIEGSPEFFAVTKRIHNRLHGVEGDGLPLDERARAAYEDVLASNAAGLAQRVRAGDLVILHDPQTAGLAERMRAAGAGVIWRCHVGVDDPNDLARDAWGFLRPYLADADAYVFSREEFVWEGLDASRIAVIAPTIDPFAPKNLDLDREAVRAVLRAVGMLTGAGARSGLSVPRDGGAPVRVTRQVALGADEPLEPDVPVVVQVSRWDALKDPLGVVRGFADHVPAETGAHLVCAGPAVDAVSDDPEGAHVLREVVAARERLPPDIRRRVHLASLPMADLDENAIIVNALQRHARVVVQKSIAEGFGLTVAEAMWKARPVVASRVGGIQEQITDGETGLLLDDPLDLEAFGTALTRLLVDPELAERIGRRARSRVVDRFLNLRSLLDYIALVDRLVVEGPAGLGWASDRQDG